MNRQQFSQFVFWKKKLKLCLFPHTTTTNLIFFTYFSNNNFLRKNQQFSAKTTKNKNKNARIITFYNQKLKRLMTVNGSNLKSINFCVTNHIKKRKIRNVKPTSQSKKKIPHFFFVKTTQQLLLLQIIFSVTWSKPALSEIQTLPILFFVHPNRNIRTSRIEEKKILETMKKKLETECSSEFFREFVLGFFLL